MSLPDQLDDDPQILAMYIAELDACESMDDVHLVLDVLRAAGAVPWLLNDLRTEQERLRGWDDARVNCRGGNA